MNSLSPNPFNLFPILYRIQWQGLKSPMERPWSRLFPGDWGFLSNRATISSAVSDEDISLRRIRRHIADFSALISISVTESSNLIIWERLFIYWNYQVWKLLTSCVFRAFGRRSFWERYHSGPSKFRRLKNGSHAILRSW